MKKVEAVIRPEKLEALKISLCEKGYMSMTVEDVKGRGVQGGVERQWRGRTYKVDLLPKMKVWIVTEDENVNELIDIILDATWTNEIGDGKIFVIPVERAITVRTKK